MPREPGEGDITGELFDEFASQLKPGNRRKKSDPSKQPELAGKTTASEPAPVENSEQSQKELFGDAYPSYVLLEELNHAPHHTSEEYLAACDKILEHFRQERDAALKSGDVAAVEVKSNDVKNYEEYRVVLLAHMAPPLAAVEEARQQFAGGLREGTQSVEVTPATSEIVAKPVEPTVEPPKLDKAPQGTKTRTLPRRRPSRKKPEIKPVIKGAQDDKAPERGAGKLWDSLRESRQAINVADFSKKDEIGKIIQAFDTAYRQLKDHYLGLVKHLPKGASPAAFQMSLDQLEAAKKGFEEIVANRSREGKDGPIWDTEAYKFFEKQFLKGQTIEEMEAIFTKGSRKPAYAPEAILMADLATAARVFSKDVREGKNDPLARVATQMTLYFLNKHPDSQMNLQKLYAATPAESEKQLAEIMKELWKDFVYSAKLDPQTGRPNQKFYDADVSISLWLLKRAGVKWDSQEHKKDEAVKPGEKSPAVLHGKLALDVGGESGAVMKEVEGPDGNKYTVMVMDNHPIFRDYPTSAAKILFHSLDRMGLLELKPKERRAAGMMLKYSEDDDNCTYEVGTKNRVKVFEQSANTLFGLGYALTAEELYEYFLEHAADGDEGKSYRRAVFSRQFTETELKDKYKLDRKISRVEWTKKEIHDPARIIAKTRRIKKEINVIERQKSTIKQVGEWLKKPWSEMTPEEQQGMIEDGRVLVTKLGVYLVDIMMPGDVDRNKLHAGYKAAWAYGYDGIMSLELHRPDNPSFLINTVRKDIDLSHDKKIMALAQKQGADMVRGVMCIKGRDKTPLKVTPEEIFQSIMPDGWTKDQSKGKIRELLVGNSEWTENRLRSRFADIKGKQRRQEEILISDDTNDFGEYVELEQAIQQLLPPVDLIKTDFKSVESVCSELYDKYQSDANRLKAKYSKTNLGSMLEEYRKPPSLADPNKREFLELVSQVPNKIADWTAELNKEGADLEKIEGEAEKLWDRLAAERVEAEPKLSTDMEKSQSKQAIASLIEFGKLLDRKKTPAVETRLPTSIEIKYYEGKDLFFRNVSLGTPSSDEPDVVPLLREADFGGGRTLTYLTRGEIEKVKSGARYEEIMQDREGATEETAEAQEIREGVRASLAVLLKKQGHDDDKIKKFLSESYFQTLIQQNVEAALKKL
ncbi:MAG: hypothetical protein Q8R08_04430, partial [bacterium]|nr:hypothetical protein [bacterium]